MFTAVNLPSLWGRVNAGGGEVLFACSSTAFDVAREGYVNLLLSGGKRPENPR